MLYMAVLGLQILKRGAKWSAERRKGGKVLCCFFLLLLLLLLLLFLLCFFFPAHFSLLRHPHYLTPKPG